MKDRRLGIYSVAHLLVDLCCLLLVCTLVRQGAACRELWGAYVVLYNGCAFALQMPFGAVADALDRDHLFSGVGSLLVALAWLLPVRSPWILCVVAGVGNALFHVGGGRDALGQEFGKAARPGIFVSTGAVGVWLGVWLAQRGGLPRWLPAAALLVAAVVMLRFCPRREELPPAVTPPPRMGKAFPAGLCLFVTVWLRAYLGSGFAFPWKVGALSLAFTLCVALGKALGGVIGDRLGFALGGAATLLPAAALCLLGFTVPVAGLGAVGLFNTTMPLTVTALAVLLGRQWRGLAFGLTTFALFLGTVTPAFPTLATPTGLGAGVLLSLAAALPGLLLYQREVEG